jgi:hypothetical protein
MIGGGNRWTDFVRDYAKMNHLSYMCALSTPECKIEYREKYGNRKKLTQKKEREMMGQEEALTKSKIASQKKKVASLKGKLDKAQAEKAKEAKENITMSIEDINVANPTQPVKKRGRPKKVKLIEPAIIEKKSRGRPKKYATAEEANKMKGVKTMEALKRRQARAKEEREMMAKEDKPNAVVVGRKRGRPKKSGGMVTPPNPSTPETTPRPPLPNLNQLIQLVQLDPTQERLNHFRDLVAGNIDAYLYALHQHFDVLVPSNPQKQNYERNINSYRDEVVVLGAGLSGGHWTSKMLPHLKKELKNYQNIIHHLGQHLHEKGEHDPKDMIGFRHFTNEATRIKKLMEKL